MPETEDLPSQCIQTVPTGTRITITLPDDFHHHFRDGPKTKSVLAHASRRFGRCIAMPNLRPPVTNTAAALEYREHILNSRPAGSTLEPLMTLYLTDRTTPEDIREAHSTSKIQACKYYPAGATTNSDFGVTDVRKTYPALREMSRLGMILCVHSEVSWPSVDIFDREARFLEEIMTPLLEDVPGLKIVLEHVSTREAVEFVQAAPSRVAATITPHHLLYTRNDLLAGGIKPHLYCLPILKHSRHRTALLKAIALGSPKFFLGTDSAPHEVSSKESACGCAGVYMAHAAIELYAESFESMGSLEKLDDFASKYGAGFYGLERNKKTITLEKKSWVVPMSYEFGGEVVRPLRAGETVAWSIVE